jgi:hypothetical protein
MDSTEVSLFFREYVLGSMKADAFLINLFLAILILVLGIFFGKIITYGLNLLAKRESFERNIRPSFVQLTISIIRWAIYIAFFNFALATLEIPLLTKVITQTLMVIPAIVASILIISVGFAIAIYLREIVEGSEVTGWKFLSLYLFYFINLVFGIYALKIALIVFDPLISQIISVLTVGIVGISIAYVIVKKELREPLRQK